MDSIRKFFTFACITLLIYTLSFLFFIMVSLMFMRKNMRAVLAVQFAGLAWASSCHVCLGLA